jgi:tetratricopeptide (TPR) repeat protein
MDTRYFKKTAGVLGTALLMFAANNAQASDADLPSPFAPVTAHKESLGERWRHPFHDIRTTWDKYFETYAKDLDGYEPATLDKIRATPKHYLDRKFHFDVYMGRPGQYYRPFLTPFTDFNHINFTAWPYGAELWTKEGRNSIHPFLYVDRVHKELCDKVTSLPAYAPYRVWGTVRSTTENTAWIEIQNIEAIPETPLTESTLRAMELGASQLSKKRFALAAQSLSAAVQLQMPVSTELKAYGMLARANMEMRDYGAARNALVNAIIRDRDNAANLVLLARADLKMQKADEAREAAEAAIKIEPSNALAYAELGLALAWLDDMPGAYKALDFAQVLGRNQLPEAFRNRAMVALRENNPEMARDELNQAVILRPTDVDLKLELGDVYISLKDLDKAKLEFSQARDLEPERAEPHYKVAVVGKAMGDELKAAGKAAEAKAAYEEALGSVRDAITRDKKFGAAYMLRSELLRELGMPEEPIPAGVVSSAKPLDAQTYEVSYQQAELRGDFTGMIQLTREAISARPDSMLFSRLGSLLASQPEPDLNGAAAAYAEAVRLSPERAKDWASLGAIQLRANRNPMSAEASLSQAVKLDPTNGFALYDLACAQRMLGNPAAALQSATLSLSNGGPTASAVLAAQSHLDLGTPEDLSAALAMAAKAHESAATDTEKAQCDSITATALMRQAKIDEALPLFEKADPVLGAIDPEHDLAYGLALLTKGESATAQQKLKTAMGLAQINKDSDKVAMNVYTGAEAALRGSEKGAPSALPVSNDPSIKPVQTKGAPVIEDSEPLPVVVPGER